MARQSFTMASIRRADCCWLFTPFEDGGWMVSFETHGKDLVADGLRNAPAWNAENPSDLSAPWM
jgi:hypothetical protein